MRFDTGQHMRMGQQMKLAPRMIQSMEILQMPQQALEERIEQELASNPTLEQVEAGDDLRKVQEERDQATRDDREGEREMVVDGEGKDGQHSADDFERLNNSASSTATPGPATPPRAGRPSSAARSTVATASGTPRWTRWPTPRPAGRRCTTS